MTYVWITARDGSLHATFPPIVADAQPMLCGRSYSRRDLRVNPASSAGRMQDAPCAQCRDHILTALGGLRSA